MINQKDSTTILDYCKQMGYPINKSFNIIYLEGADTDGRVNSDSPNQFNDVRCIFDAIKCIDCWGATCEPGAWYTNHPMNSRGAFRIAFGFHQNAWEIGLHGNSEPHQALIQIAEIKGHRDYNRDMIRTGDELVTGLYGINQHWGYDLPVSDIGLASAGCLVGRTRDGHEQFMRYCQNSGLSRFSTIVIPADKVLK